MFGSNYVAIVGYYDGDYTVYCVDCAKKLEAAGVNIHGETWTPIYRYQQFEEEEPDTCDTCGETLVEW